MRPDRSGRPGAVGAGAGPPWTAVPVKVARTQRPARTSRPGRSGHAGFSLRYRGRGGRRPSRYRRSRPVGAGARRTNAPGPRSPRACGWSRSLTSGRRKPRKARPRHATPGARASSRGFWPSAISPLPRRSQIGDKRHRPGRPGQGRKENWDVTVAAQRLDVVNSTGGSAPASCRFRRGSFVTSVRGSIFDREGRLSCDTRCCCITPS